MFEALREPGVRAVLGTVSGGLLALAGVIILSLADGLALRVLAALGVLAGVAVIASGVRARRRLRD